MRNYKSFFKSTEYVITQKRASMKLQIWIFWKRDIRMNWDFFYNINGRFIGKLLLAAKIIWRVNIIHSCLVFCTFFPLKTTPPPRQIILPFVNSSPSLLSHVIPSSQNHSNPYSISFYLLLFPPNLINRPLEKSQVPLPHITVLLLSYLQEFPTLSSLPICPHLRE